MDMRAILALVIFLASASGAMAQSTEIKKSGARILGAVFTELEKTTIRSLFGTEVERQTSREPSRRSTHQTGRYDEDTERRRGGKNKGRGRAKGKGKFKGMPAGLARHIKKHGQLPPGLEKKRLPRHIEAKLPPVRKGTERVVAGNDVVLMDIVTGTVLDIIYEVIIHNR
ncbi:MAG: hypothetical protein HOE84_10540 [Rhodospirillaceae bacterium]|nr:hypothetical protein [Rhodospirillaceae bacterium]